MLDQPLVLTDSVLLVVRGRDAAAAAAVARVLLARVRGLVRALRGGRVGGVLRGGRRARPRRPGLRAGGAGARVGELRAERGAVPRTLPSVRLVLQAGRTRVRLRHVEGVDRKGAKLRRTASGGAAVGGCMPLGGSESVERWGRVGKGVGGWGRWVGEGEGAPGGPAAWHGPAGTRRGGRVACRRRRRSRRGARS